jgi:hypothetical protein
MASTHRLFPPRESNLAMALASTNASPPPAKHTVLFATVFPAPSQGLYFIIEASRGKACSQTALPEGRYRLSDCTRSGANIGKPQSKWWRA